MSVCGISRAGRRPRNEDSWWGGTLPDASSAAVADGVGGHAAGDVASSIAIRRFAEIIRHRYREGMEEGEVAELLRDAFLAAHRAILDEATGPRAGMATTLTAAIIRNRRCIAANCGDSRLQIVRSGAIVSGTRDHSYVRLLVDGGRLTPEAARLHPLRNIITHALGGDFTVDIYKFPLLPGDAVLLTTDGVHDALPEDVIAALTATGTCRERLGRLVEAALRVSEDNVTAAIIVV
ncbi:MAG: PP2C family protein-serine/threonine phosphatase [Methanoculleaceae archaeon]